MLHCQSPRLPGRLLAGLLSAVLGASLALTSQPTRAAISVTLTDATPTLVADAATCKSLLNGKDFSTCKSTATVSTTAIGGGAAPDVEFKKSFDAWNAGLPAAGKWTLVSAGLLPGGTLKISVFDASAADTSGGVEIRVLWDYDGTTKDQYYWAQGLLDNYTLAPLAIVPPFYEMDNAGSGISALYPFQYEDKHFYDKPAAPWPNSSFTARALLARQDSAFRTLTVYEGVAYSFALSGVAVVPEPASALLALAGLAWLAARRMRG